MTALVENTVKKAKIRRYPECRSTHLVKRQDENRLICMECGFVISPETIKLSMKEKSLLKMNTLAASSPPLPKKSSSKGPAQVISLVRWKT